MSAWGTGPFENSDAAALIDPVWQKIRTLFRSRRLRAFDESEYNEIRAAAQLMILAPDILGFPGMWEDAITALEAIKDDEEWIDGWETPYKIQHDLVNQIAALEELVLEREANGRVAEQRTV